MTPRSVVTPQERGYRGRLAVEAKYGKRVTDSWRRKGGRKPNRTIDEIRANGRKPRQRPGPSRPRSVTRQEGTPITGNRPA